MELKEDRQLEERLGQRRRRRTFVKEVLLKLVERVVI